MTDQPYPERLRAARVKQGLTQVAVAEALGVSQSAVAQWESGQSVPAEGTASKIERLLGIKYLAADREQRPAPREVLDTRPRLPIVGSPSPGDDERILIDNASYGEILSPPQLEGVNGAKAVFVRGRSMEPRYFAGEVVYLHPRRPNPGDFVLITLIEPGYQTKVGYIRQYLGEDLVSLRLATLNPRKEDLVERKNVVAMETIVGSGLF